MESPESDTIFAKIIRREIPAEIIYEDELTIAFLDAYPNHAGHSLVVPKKWSRNILDIDPETLDAVMATVQKVATAVKEGVAADGVNVYMNNEPAAGQVIFHTHIHVIPRYENDGLKPFPSVSYAPGEKEAIAEKIRLLMR